MNEKSRGFTLIELLVTIAIIAILATLAVPSFNSVIQANELKAGTNKVLFVLSEAKNNARLMRQVSVLKFDQSYSVPSASKEFNVDSDIAKNVLLATDDKAISFLANGLIQTDSKKYPVCLSVKHSKSSNVEYITISQLGFITLSKTSC